MSNYPDGMGRSWMLDAEDINLSVECPKCKHESDQDLETFDRQVRGEAWCPECEHTWDVDTYIEPDIDPSHFDD